MINIIESRYIKDFKVQLLFEISDYKADKKEQVQKEADFREYIMAKKETGVFAPLKDVEFFKNFRLNANTIEWANGADIAPEIIYELAESKKI